MAERGAVADTWPRTSAGAGAHARAQRQRAPSTGIDYGPLAEWLGFHLRMAQIASFQAFAREVGEVDLPPGPLRAADADRPQPRHQPDRAQPRRRPRQVDADPALRDLKRRGLIARERLASDRRSYHLTLTPGGQAMLRRLTECAARHERNLDRIVGARDRGGASSPAALDHVAIECIQRRRGVEPQRTGGQASANG